MKHFRKSVSILLISIIILSCMPFSAYAAETENLDYSEINGMETWI